MNLGELTPDLKVLIDAEIESAAPPGTLPSPTDEGDVLTVVSGDWAGAPGGSLQKTAKLTLLAADLNNLASTPFELVPAQGSDKLIVPYALTARYNPGDIGYSVSGDYLFNLGPITLGGGVQALTLFNSLSQGTTPCWVAKELLFEHMMFYSYVFSACQDQPFLLAQAVDNAGADSIDESSVTVANGGTGYSVNDIVTIAGGDANARARVSAVNTGVVTAVDFSVPVTEPGVFGQGALFTNSGTGYAPGSGIATSGAGDDALTLNIGAVGDGDGTVDLVLDYTIVDLS